MAFILALSGVSYAGAALRYEAVSDSGVTFLLVSGEFEHSDDLSLFEAAVAKHKPAAVLFDSSGGNLKKAMDMGMSIRRNGLDTIQLRKYECVSACALAFMGGVNRIAEPGSIGVHQSTFGDGYGGTANNAVAEIQMVVAYTISYMTEMGIDPSVMHIALSTPSDDMRYLSSGEMKQFRITADREEQPNAAAPSVALPSAVPVPSQNPQSSAELEKTVQEFTVGVIYMHDSSVSKNLDRLMQNYAAEIDYYGKPRVKADVADEKRSYFARWPNREISVDDPSTYVSCNRAECTVSGQYRYNVKSGARNKVASGWSTFEYRVNPTPPFRIHAESGKIITRD